MSERGRLAAALGAHVRRRRALGERRTAGWVDPRVEVEVSPPAVHPESPPTTDPTPARPTHPKPPPTRGEQVRDRAKGPAVAVSGPDSGPLPAALAPDCGDLGTMAEAVAGCRACGLCQGRTQTVFADGTGRARVMFIGEAPGFHEDRQGVPFVGRAGQLLTDIIEKGMGLKREDVFIANVLKCRPPDNRDPTAEEKRLCTPWLDRQVELVDPKVLIPLGRHAAGHILGSEASMGRLRGRVHDLGGRKVVPTYHPAYLLRNPSAKRECWQDIQLAMAELGLEPPGRDPAQGR